VDSSPGAAATAWQRSPASPEPSRFRTTEREAPSTCFVSGHDFSRAVNAAKSMRALAPEGKLIQTDPLQFAQYQLVILSGVWRVFCAKRSRRTCISVAGFLQPTSDSPHWSVFQKYVLCQGTTSVVPPFHPQEFRNQPARRSRAKIPLNHKAWVPHPCGALVFAARVGNHER
jgi:hypothetical protein